MIYLLLCFSLLNYLLNQCVYVKVVNVNLVLFVYGAAAELIC